MEVLKSTKTIFHVHTYHSIDSFLKPDFIVDTFYDAKIDNVIITDHNSIRGAVEAKDYAEKKYGNRINVIIGEEVKTDIGDIIGFPISNEIQMKEHAKVIDEIKNQGGFVCLPHPYKSHNLLKIHKQQFIDSIDFIEIFNARISAKLNAYAEEMASYYNKHTIVGADAHVKGDLFNASFVFNNNLEIIERSTTYTSKRNFRLSQLVQNLKEKNIAGIVKYYLLSLSNR